MVAPGATQSVSVRLAPVTVTAVKGVNPLAGATVLAVAVVDYRLRADRQPAHAGRHRCLGDLANLAAGWSVDPEAVRDVTERELADDADSVAQQRSLLR